MTSCSEFGEEAVPQIGPASPSLTSVTADELKSRARTPGLHRDVVDFLATCPKVICPHASFRVICAYTGKEVVR